MGTTIKTDVIIVGAGPTGLALACQLIRFGIEFVIFDRKEGITDLSKAVAVQARTLEIYEQLGLAERAVSQGAIARAANIVTNGRVRGSVGLSDIGKELSPFPFALLLEQSKNERLLEGYLHQHGRSVRWETALASVAQDGAEVKAAVEDARGETQELRAKYLVGCDGAGSSVRRQLAFAFEGTTVDALFYVADVDMEFAGNHDEIYVSFGADSFVALFPLKDENFWRIVGNLPDEENARREEGEVNYDETEARVRGLMQMPLDVRGVKWFSTYRVHSRRVDRFRDRRCFLAGDAAHIHTPAGGQGMNTGIGDAYNLAWKLAFVLREKAGESLLDTYNSERLENAKNLLETTDRAFTLGTQGNFLAGVIRAHVLPLVAQYALRLDWVKQTIFPFVSQIGVNYRHSALSRHAGDENFKVKAGDRMPYFRIGGESIYDRLRRPAFHLLVFSDTPGDARTWETTLADRAAGSVDFGVVPLHQRVAEVFGTDEPFTVLLRPDNHIGFIATETSPDDLRDYLTAL